MTGVFSSLTPGPSMTRSWSTWPLFVKLNEYMPADRLVLGSSILNSDSVTGTLFGAPCPAPDTDVEGVVAVLFGVEGVVVGGGGVAVDRGRVSPAVEPASAWLSLGSRPKKKTANIIPTNRAT